VPTRHCVIFEDVNHPQWRLGIWQVFEPWVDPRLQALQGLTPTITRPLTIEFHFRRVVIRLVRSLARLYHSCREWDRFLDAGGLKNQDPELAFKIPEEAGISADSVFHYLNLFIDDLGRATYWVLLEDGVKDKEPDSFSALKKMLSHEKLPSSKALSKLFAELDKKDSWWSLGFSFGVGMRQRLTHYTDLLTFAGSTKPGDTKMTADVSLVAVGDSVLVADFENILKKLLADLCEWLDRLEQELIPLLSGRLKQKRIRWNPLDKHTPPTIVLPTLDLGNLDPSYYSYLPVCKTHF
jgi:hypothetical protein